MKKKHLVHVLLFLLLMVAGYLIFKDRASTLPRSVRDFAIDPGTRVNSFSITRGDSSLKIIKTEEGWKLEDNIFTRKELVLTTIRALSVIQIKSPVPKSKRDSITGVLNEQGKLVVFYSGNKKVREFYTTDGPSPATSYMLIKGKNFPFITEIPGLNRGPATLFDMDEKYWQGNTVFNFSPAEISLVHVRNYKNPSESFKIKKVNDRYELYTGKENEPAKAPGQGLIMSYLAEFSDVSFEKWNSSVKKQKEDTPLYKIQVITQNELEITLEIYRIINREEVDPDRFTGLIQGSDRLFIAKYLEFDPLLVKPSFFYETPTSK